MSLAADWGEIFAKPALVSLTTALQRWLPSRRWFRGKARTIESVNIREQIAVRVEGENAFLLLFQVNYEEGGPELYVLPVACAFGEDANAIDRDMPQLVLLHISLNRPNREGVVYDAIISKNFCHALLVLTARRQTMPGYSGDLEAEPTGILREIQRNRGLEIEPKVSKAEQSNSSIIYDGSIILKFFRRLEAGVNPELEMERFLSAREFPYSPPLAGALEYHEMEGATSTMAVLTSFIPDCRDAWEDTLSALRGFYKKVRHLPAKLKHAPPASEAVSAILGHSPLPPKPVDLIGQYLQDAGKLGQRTASLHLTLASAPADPAFRPEPWDAREQQSQFESLCDLTRRTFQLLRQRLATLEPGSRPIAQRVLSLEHAIVERFRRMIQQPISALRIRTHGDYHLGQVLHHGSDFLIIDFEGEPAISLEERRQKQSALRDVAGMLYSFFYAAHTALDERPAALSARLSLDHRTAWARYWSVWVGTNYLRSYLEMAGSAPFIPKDETVLKILLDVELLRKAIYELGYELNNRPDWVNIAFQVLLDLLNTDNPI
ncbi:MAG: putative maltokinase [Verrucomicrobiota bacterium]